MLGRYCNRVQQWATDTATDANVTRRRWLLIDLDPARPKNTAATDAQVQAARESAERCYRMLKAEGWPEPLAGESGNGWHLLYPLDLPNDPESTALVKGALAGLAARLDGDGVKVDQTVFNAGRITKLYGTVATKGDHTPGAPWRLSALVSTPTRGEQVMPDQLRALHPAPAGGAKPSAPTTPAVVPSFDLAGFLSRLGIGYTQDSHDGRDRYRLDHCPFNEAHGKGEAAIFRDAAGKLGFRCQHDSCSGKHWQDVRALLDGPREARGDPAPDRTDWPEPQPLSAKVDPEAYPLDALPEGIRAAVQEVAGFVKAPLALVASSALGALSLAAQAQADVRRAERLEGPAGLFILAIADSGERKTTCDGFFTGAIRDFEAEQAEAAKPALKKYAADSSAWTAEREGILSAIKEAGKKGKPAENLRNDLAELEHAKPEPPRVPRLIFGDATPEALTWALSKQWPAAGVMSSEAGSIFGSHGMGRDSIMRNLGILNQLWDGARLTFDRRSSESYTVRGARLTVALQVQEATLRDFLGRAGALARGSGFLARFLVAWPESTQGHRAFTEAPASWPALAVFNRRLAAILAEPVVMDDDGALVPPVIGFAPDARRDWIAFHDGIEAELRSGGELHDVRDVAAKAADNAARLAALFHAFEGSGGAIGADAFAGAARIVAWHLSESRRFFGELALPAELADAARLDAWLIEHCQRERVGHADRREAQRGGPVRDGERLTAALRVLAELDRVREARDGKRKLILLNPALHARQA
ncbi:MAG: YfjI family protein [Pseudomonadota bacterium]|nr:YfjI family protein [Pseudomonadota bacterium]